MKGTDARREDRSATVPAILRTFMLMMLISAAVIGSGSAQAEADIYVDEGGWWYAEDDFNACGTPIQAAVDNATAGDTIFVYNGSYVENVDVNKQITLEGEGADVVTVTAASGTDHVFEVTADGVGISGFTATGANNSWGKAGVYVYNVDHCSISRNDVFGNYWGIYLGGCACSSSYNTLTNNTVNSNDGYGIYLYSSNYNMLTDNNASSNGDDGIYLGYSSNYNTLSNNTANSNDGYGIQLRSSNNYNTLANNTASNNSGGINLYGSSNYNTLKSNTVNSNKYYGINLWNSSSNTLSDNTANLNDNVCGIYVEDSSNNTLMNNTASNNPNGICLSSSSSNTLSDNTANSNIARGIEIRFSSSNNTLTNNTANSNGYCGIELSYSNDNVLMKNAANSNNGAGICLGSLSSNNTLTNNAASLNNNIGIYLRSSSNNNINKNTANSNNRGILLWNSSNNNITCNLVQDNIERGFEHSGEGNNISLNNIIENGDYNAITGGYEWQLYNEQDYDVNAANNWWGTNDCAAISASICGGNVSYLPRLDDLATCAPTPEPHTYTAAIALQIAVGSRLPDLRYDVSGDNRVTSLDALMILQAAAGSIEL